MEEKIYTVSQVNKYIKLLFDRDEFLKNVTIKGEITNFKAHYTGHLYFTLKDELSTIRCVMFKSFADLIKFKPADGMKVNITGQISLFERDGTYQIYCKTMSPEGLGELYLAYSQLKEKLEKEGLFSPQYKKKIPFLPERVGIITSKTGAVVNDIINVTTRRFEKVNLLIYPVAVQGVNVASTVIEAIKYFNNKNNVDAIIIARGGGSFEDLFGFNDENLAREIFKSHIPIISAVGHETDFTICDFVSDLRAPTPSAAAELVYPQYSELISKISQYKIRNIQAIKNYIIRKREYVARIKASKLEKAPLDLININRMNIERLLKSNENTIKFKVQKYRTEFSKIITKIDTLSPLKTLSRGYSVIQDNNDKIINSIQDIKKDDEIRITLTDGKISAIVK